MSTPAPSQDEHDPLASKPLWLFIIATFALLILSIWLPLQDILIHWMMHLGADRFLQRTTVPYELRFVSTLVSLLGFHIQQGRQYITWQNELGKQEYLYFTWNCGGWQSFLLFFASATVGLWGRYTRFSKWETLLLGVVGTYLFTLFRLMAVLLVYIWVGRPLGILFHDYATVCLTFGYLALFWWVAKRFVLKEQQGNSLPLHHQTSHLDFGRGIIALVLCIALLANYPVFFPGVPIAQAAGNPTIEQQINIADSAFTGGAASDGIALIDTASYTGATVSYYFEVDAKVTSGTGTAVLTYNAGTGSTVSGGSTLTISNINTTSYARYRSASFSPTGAQNAYVSSMTGTGISVQAARIIIVQSDLTSINNSVSQIEVGDNFSTTNASDTLLTNPKYWKWDSTKYDGTVAVYFEATIQNASFTDTTTATLYQSGASCTTAVTGSAVTQTGTTYARVRSGDISGNLSSGTTYMVCIKAGTGGFGHTAQISNAHIIVQQTSSSGLTKMEIYHTYDNHLSTNTTTTLTDKNYFNTYEAGNWAGGTFTYYVEATMKTSVGTDTVTGQICYKTTSACDTTVGNTSTTASTSLSLVRSSSFGSAPPDAKELDAGLKVTTGGDTITVNHSALVIDVSSLQTPENVLPMLPLALFLPAIGRLFEKQRKGKANVS